VYIAQLQKLQTDKFAMFTSIQFKARQLSGALAVVVSLSAQTAAVADPAPTYITNADQSATLVAQPSDMVRVRHIDMPDYTNELVRSGVQGTIEVQAHIGADGRVIDAVVARAEPQSLSKAAKNVLASVRSATFYPSFENGKATDTLVTIPFHFQLADRTISTFPFKRVAKSRLVRAD
jgi:TonB family protein